MDARTTRLLLLLALLNASAASSLYLAIVPGIVHSLELTEVQGGLLVTASALAFGLAAPWWVAAGAALVAALAVVRRLPEPTRAAAQDAKTTRCTHSPAVHRSAEPR